jgi:glutamyl-Q tRNA(Asp) synthetase
LTVKHLTKSRKNRNTAEPLAYVGRFAPSPTGPLHLGSLICALATYLDARANGGDWLVRMEDLDPPREIPGAAQSILNSLKAHGLYWDQQVLWQSQRDDAYAAVVNQLLATGKAFHCDCSRAQLALQDNIYQGHCRNRKLPGDSPAAVRVKVEGESVISVNDRLQAPLHEDVASAVGDFIIHRRDGLYAYQLAVVVDDAYQGINQVLRGSDLYDSTPRQVYLQQLLELPTPSYTHIPVITNDHGQKLSKQTHAAALDDNQAIDNLRLALRFLGQRSPTPDAQRVDLLLQRAVEHWQLRDVPARMGIPENSIY